jgi:hypothetical protein
MLGFSHCMPQLPHPLLDRFEKIVGKGRLVVLNGQLQIRKHLEDRGGWREGGREGGRG